MRLPARPTCLLLLTALPVTAHAASFDGGGLSLAWIIPFAGILLSIALLPLLAPGFWHHHYGKVSAAWALAFAIPFSLTFGAAAMGGELVHTALAEYFPFIILLFALYTVAGGIFVSGNLHGSPAVNTGLLALGTVLASVMGTTGAAMLLVRPLIRANDNRRHKVHVIVFFIFLVGNIGGSLTPLGDPPLFLGFLKGVDFFWTTRAMLAPTLFLAGILLALFFLLDTFLYRRAGEERPVQEDPTPDSWVGIRGGWNILLLAGVVASVLMSGLWKPGVNFHVLGTDVPLQGLVRDALLLALAGLSLYLTPRAYREANAFSWGPMAEVAKLFAGIFVTIIPAIAILKAGRDGALAQLVAMVTLPAGGPDNVAYFWLTGALSSFLDNAPTYLVFFNLAGGDAATLMTTHAPTLLAISCGAVFMGANTYIGNAPNFMVKAIAEERGIAMPSFIGYMGWSAVFLLPLFLLLGLLFFR